LTWADGTPTPLADAPEAEGVYYAFFPFTIPTTQNCFAAEVGRVYSLYLGFGAFWFHQLVEE
jgi:hypothetical protein